MIWKYGKKEGEVWYDFRSGFLTLYVLSTVFYCLNEGIQNSLEDSEDILIQINGVEL